MKPYFKNLNRTGKASNSLTIPKKIIEAKKWDKRSILKIWVNNNIIFISEKDNVIDENAVYKKLNESKNRGYKSYRVLIPNKFLNKIDYNNHSQHFKLTQISNLIKLEKTNY